MGGSIASRHPVLAHIAGNMGWLLLERAVTLVTGFAVNIWFVRYLGPDTYGIYAYAVSYCALFAAVAGLGLETIVIRELSKCPERAGELLGTALAIRATTGLLATAAIILSTLAFRTDKTTLLIVSIVSGTALFQGLGVFDFWYQAKVAASPAVIARTATTLVVHCARCALIVARAPLTAFAALFAAGSALTTFAVYGVFRRSRPPVRLKFDRALVAPLLADAWPMVISGLAVNIYMRIDQVMLTRMTTAHETGIYATAVSLSELWWIIPGLLVNTLFPMIVQTRASDDHARYERMSQVVYDSMAAGSYAIAIAVSLLAGPIVGILLGPRYLQAAPVLQVHVWTLLFVALGSARTRFLIAEGLTRLPMIATAAGGVLNILLNVLLIPRYGGLGAAVATLLAQCFSAFASGVFFPELRGHTKRISLALLVPFRPGALRHALTRSDAVGQVSIHDQP